MVQTDSLTYNMALTGLAHISVTLVCVALAWWGLQQIRLDVFLKNPKSPQSKLLLIMVSLALGYEVALFLITYFEWSGLLKGMF